MSLGVIDHPYISDPWYTTAIISWFSEIPVLKDGFPWINIGAFLRGFHFSTIAPEGVEATTLLDVYYGSYGLCFIASFFLLRAWQRKGSFRVRKVHLYDMVLVYMIGMLAGAKLGYVLFYNWEYYSQYPSQILTNWSGMASHGTMIGVVIAIWIWARKQKLNYWHVMDHLALCAPFGGLFIRSANFLNGELYGKPVDEDFPLAMHFPMRDDRGQQLYVDKAGQVYAGHFYEGGQELETPYFVKSEAKTEYREMESFIKMNLPIGKPDATKQEPQEKVIAARIAKPSKGDEASVELTTADGDPMVVDEAGNFYAVKRYQENTEKDGKPHTILGNYAEPVEFDGEYEFYQYKLPTRMPLESSESQEFITAQRLMTGPVHPSQLYQGFMTGVVLLVLLLLIRRKAKRVGVIFGSFLLIYGGGRILTEYFRQQDYQRADGIFQYISMGQILSICLITAGAVIFLRQRKQGALISELPNADQLRDAARERARAAGKLKDDAGESSVAAEDSAPSDEPSDKPKDEKSAD